MKKNLHFRLKKDQPAGQTPCQSGGHFISEMAEEFLDTGTAGDNCTPTEGSAIADLACSLLLDDKRPY